MQTAIGYLRVSTKEQGRRGFSLETQRRDIGAFGAHEGFTGGMNALERRVRNTLAARTRRQSAWRRW
jgi:DNA invertase Pin-like site-specific DNA recombinase